MSDLRGHFTTYLYYFSHGETGETKQGLKCPYHKAEVVIHAKLNNQKVSKVNPYKFLSSLRYLVCVHSNNNFPLPNLCLSLSLNSVRSLWFLCKVFFKGALVISISTGCIHC